MSIIRALLYAIPGLMPTYHFLWSFFGAFYFRFPSKDIRVIGITGTKGKTTVLELMNSFLEARGEKTAMLSSVAVKIGDEREKNTSDTTMPGRLFIQRFLRRAVEAGCNYALLEVSSQGVIQSRHRFIAWNRAFLINLHPEHIEAHGSFERYRGAKLSFLRYAARKGAKVFVNADDAESGFFLTRLKGHMATPYHRADVPLVFFDANPNLAGDFNNENVAAAVVLAEDLGVGDEVIFEVLKRFHGVPGRMEYVQREPFAAVVDYAHTPVSLEAVYRALRGERNRLICVLGSAGGGRDKWKRPEMGRIAATYCDRIILTDEDSYDEDPRRIIAEITAGIPAAAKEKTMEVLDRGEAIRMAIREAVPGDTVVVTGKGSEAWMHFSRGKKVPWSDRETVASAIPGRT